MFFFLRFLPYVYYCLRLRFLFPLRPLSLYIPTFLSCFSYGLPHLYRLSRRFSFLYVVFLSDVLHLLILSFPLNSSSVLLCPYRFPLPHCFCSRVLLPLMYTYVPLITFTFPCLSLIRSPVPSCSPLPFPCPSLFSLCYTPAPFPLLFIEAAVSLLPSPCLSASSFTRLPGILIWDL